MYLICQDGENILRPYVLSDLEITESKPGIDTQEV
jgi:hypothetical protein